MSANAKIQYQEKQKRKRNRLQMRGPLHPKGHTPIKHEIVGEPAWKPMPRTMPGFPFGGLFESLNERFNPFWRRRQQKMRQFEKPQGLKRQ